MGRYVVRVGYRDFLFNDLTEAAFFAKMGVEHIEEGEELILTREKEEDSSTEPCAPDSKESSNEPL